MAAEKNVVIVEGLQEFLQAIEPGIATKDKPKFFETNSDEIFWYRGQSDMTWHLEPTLYRKVRQAGEPGNFWERLQEAEKKTYEEFEVRNYHFLNRPPQGKYLWLSLMQHYNLATRLLDWSEQAIPALFFAVSDYYKQVSPVKDCLPCVWVLKPNQLARHSIRYFNSHRIKKYPANTTGSMISLIKVHEDLLRAKLCDSIPLPVLAPHTNDRIHAQSGVFTIFPIEKRYPEKMWGKKEEYYYLETLPDANEFLFQLIILDPKRVSNQLKQLGFKLSMFFPEIPNVSSEIEEKFLREIKK